jgi:hypothetical protein
MGSRRYNYRTERHRKWAQGVKEAGDGCYICGRGAAPRRKGQRIHAHHLHGTTCDCGLPLCPTCHSMVTGFSGPAKKVWLSRSMMKKFKWVVNERLKGHTDA